MLGLWLEISPGYAQIVRAAGHLQHTKTRKGQCKGWAGGTGPPSVHLQPQVHFSSSVSLQTRRKTPRTLSGAWQTGSCPVAAAHAEAERLCSVGERHGAGVCRGLLTRQGALYSGNRKGGPGNVASKQLEGLYFPLACSYSLTLWPRSPLPQCF